MHFVTPPPQTIHAEHRARIAEATRYGHHRQSSTPAVEPGPARPPRRARWRRRVGGRPTVVAVPSA
jgi:hypothetical protein